MCQEFFLDLCDIDQTRMLSIREAVSIGILGGGQGFIKCNYSGNRKKCGTNRCKFFTNALSFLRPSMEHVTKYETEVGFVLTRTFFMSRDALEDVCPALLLGLCSYLRILLKKILILN